jgi:ATP phosphoribosyltransferase
MITLLCPPETVHELAIFLREAGAETVIVASPEYVFSSDFALYDALLQRLDQSD